MGKDNLNKNYFHKFIDFINTLWFNKWFLFLNFIFFAILLISIDMQFKNESFYDANSIGVVAQIISGIVCCVISLIGIACSLQDDEFLGIKTKDLLSMRIKWHYSITASIVISIALLGLNILFYFFKQYIICIGVFIVSLMLCIFVICSEMPLMMKNKKAGIQILKNKFLDDSNKNEINSEMLDKALKNLIIEKNLRTAYDSMCFNNSELNKKILLKLLDLQRDIALSLKYCDDKLENFKLSECIINNARDMLRFSFDIQNILGKELNQQSHYVIGTLYNTYMYTIDGKETIENFLDYLLLRLNYNTDNKEKSEFVFSIIFGLITVTVKNNDFTLLEVIRKYFYKNSYVLDREKIVTNLFSMTSMFFLYLHSFEEQTPVELKLEIERFISIGDKNSKNSSWCYLFKRYISSFNVSAKSLYEIYNKFKSYMEYYSDDGLAHWIILDDRFFIEWYLSNLFNSYRSIKYDYNELKNLSNETINYTIIQVGEKYFDESHILKVSPYMEKMLSLYKINNKFNRMMTNENVNNTFFNFINSLKKDSHFEESIKNSCIDNKELASKYKNMLIDIVEKEWGFDKTLALDNETKYLKLLIEKDAVSINADEVYIEYISKCIFSEFRNNLNIETIAVNGDFEQLMDGLLEYDLKHYSSDEFFILHFLKSDDLKKKFKEKATKMTPVESEIFDAHCYFFLDEFSFNCSIDNLSIDPLEVEEINKLADKYKREDGQYVYESTFFDREELIDILKNKMVILTLELKYNILNNNAPIYYINFHDDNMNETY